MKISNFVRSPLKYLNVIGRYFRSVWYAVSLSSIGELKSLSANEITHYFQMVRSDNRYNFRQRWTAATSIAKTGKYLEAVALRKEIMRDARRLIGADTTYVPHILESDFLSHYGHLALLNYVKLASENSLISGRNFSLTANQQHLIDRPFLRSALDGVQITRSFGGSSILDHNSLFGISDKTLLVSAQEDYMDMQIIINLVEESVQKDKRIERFCNVSPTEIAEFESLTGNFKLRGYDWFATVHVRTTAEKATARDNSFENLLPLIKYIKSDGGFVIIIGEHNPNDLRITSDSILDFRLAAKGKPHLVDIAISEAKYFIGPDSGPSAHAVYLGVPTLRVDGVALMKNTYSTHAPSISLPKFWTDHRGNRIDWRQIAQSDLGFCENSFANGGFQLNKNSAVDILESFKELKRAKEFNSLAEVDANNKLLLELKSKFGGVGSGLVASCFFE
jgi:putative glycosyltransferase (TIGR04372 family)